MIRFECDYLEGTHESILQAVSDANFEQNPGYGEDHHCAHARELIRQACGDSTVNVEFLVGGTQTNLTVIAACLKSYQGVVAATTGHINCHEEGAIEATGHKVMAVPTTDGKLQPGQIRQLCRDYWDDTHCRHLVQPGMVYISQTTEVGTLYSRQEIQDIYDVCQEFKLLLFVDGARLGYALACPDCDMTLQDLPGLCDVFTIGGTKQGAMFGEAIVIMNDMLKVEFPFHVKQRGGLLAKGWLLGVQYETLFTDDLYFKLARHAAKLAVKLHEGFADAGFSFYMEGRTNQQLPIFTQEQATALGKKYSFDYFAPLPDGRIATRFCSSWATKEENVDMLLEDIKHI